MKFKLIYITAPDKSIATNIAKTLVQEKLAACVNIIGSIESHYIWEDELVQNDEILLFAKTTKTLEARLLVRVKELHPYKVPCVISLDITNGEPNFLKWIKES